MTRKIIKHAAPDAVVRNWEYVDTRRTPLQWSFFLLEGVAFLAMCLAIGAAVGWAVGAMWSAALT